MEDTRVIKRYSNRKLYDTAGSRYVKLDDIAQLIREGEDIKVVDNDKDGADITAVTLAQIIFEAEKKCHFMPLGLLRDLVQGSGSAFGDFARGEVSKVQARANEFRESAQATATNWRDTAQDRADKIKDKLPELKAPALVPVRELLASTQAGVDELHRSLDERIHGGVDAMTQGFAAELDDIRSRIANLRVKLTK